MTTGEQIASAATRLGLPLRRPPLPAGLLTRFENASGAALPQQVRGFLANYRPASFTPELSYPLAEPSPWGQKGLVNRFFGFSPDPLLDIRIPALETYPGRIPDETIPIAADPGGNLVLIGVSGMAREQVFFWDHEHRQRRLGVAEMAADLADEGVDLRRLDAAGVLRRWEQLFPESRTGGTRLSTAPGWGNVYRVAATFELFLMSCAEG